MALFPDPAARAARYKQLQIAFNQNSRGNAMHNTETGVEKAKDNAWSLFTKHYSEKVFNAKLKIQGKLNQAYEDTARRLATSGKVNEGGRSRRYGDNIGLMASSKISQMQKMVRFVGGEGAAANANTGAIQLASRLGAANSKVVGVGAQMGVQYTKKNQAFEAIKLAAKIGTGDWGGAFGTLGEGGTGGNASMFQWMGGKSKTEGWLT